MQNCALPLSPDGGDGEARRRARAFRLAGGGQEGRGGYGALTPGIDDGGGWSERRGDGEAENPKRRRPPAVECGVEGRRRRRGSGGTGAVKVRDERHGVGVAREALEAAAREHH